MGKSDGNQVVTLSGSLTIDRAVELRSTLLEALDSRDEVLLDLGGAGEIDLSFLQILCSAHKTSLIRHKRFALEGKRPEVLERIVKEAGFRRQAGCKLDKQKCCLWIGGME
jgi:anti-anti-sigma regulatory factor